MCDAVVGVNHTYPCTTATCKAVRPSLLTVASWEPASSSARAAASLLSRATTCSRGSSCPVGFAVDNELRVLELSWRTGDVGSLGIASVSHSHSSAVHPAYSKTMFNQRATPHHSIPSDIVTCNKMRTQAVMDADDGSAARRFIFSNSSGV
jgi:hypothetical protein